MACLVPTLHGEQRLTKVLIVTRTIEYLHEQQGVRVVVEREMEGLRAENQRLVSELDAMRSQVTGAVDALVPAKAPHSTEEAAPLRPLQFIPAEFGSDVTANAIGNGLNGLTEASYAWSGMDSVLSEHLELPFVSDIPEWRPQHRGYRLAENDGQVAGVPKLYVDPVSRADISDIAI